MTLSNADPATDRKRRRMYWTNFTVMFFLLLLVCLLVCLVFAAYTGTNLLRYPVLPIFPLALSFVLAAQAFHHKGWPMTRQSLETLPAPRKAADLPAAVVYADPSGNKVAAAAFAFFAILVALLIRFGPSAHGTERYGYLLAALWLAVSLAFGIASRRRSLVASADAAGITGLENTRRKFVPWEQIASCDIKTIDYILLNSRQQTIRLKSDTDQILAVLSLTGADTSQADAFVQHLRERCTPRQPVVSPVSLDATQPPPLLINVLANRKAGTQR